jgi:phospholipid/cholesterol/gamma-HCH transport system ATP-binding protein
MIQLIDVHKAFGPQQVLEGVHLEIPTGQTTVIIGRSGGGKSVLLKHLIGLIRPDAGEVLVDGVDIARLGDRELNEIRKKFGMLFQEAALFDSMNVLENVAFPLREHTRMTETEIRQTVADRLRAVGLPGWRRRCPRSSAAG